HVARIRPKAASGMDTRTTRAKTPASLRPATASAPVPPFRPPARASAISTGSGIRGHARRAREHVLPPKRRREPGCASLTRATTRSPDKAKGRIRDGHPNHLRQDTSLATPATALAPVPLLRPARAPAISAGSGIRGHARRWRASMSSHPKGEGNPGALRLPGLRHVARIRPKAASGMHTRTTHAKTPASLRRPRPWRPSLSSAPPAPRPFPREAAFEDMRAGGARACPLTQRERGTRVRFAYPGYDT